MDYAKTRLSYLAIAKNTLIKLQGWCVMSWLKGLFGGKSDGSQSVIPLSDRKYEQLFLQVLQGVAANCDECYGEQYMVTKLRDITYGFD